MKRLATFIATLAVSVLGYSALTTTSASAATLTWNNQNGDYLCSADNWTPEKMPENGDSLVFPENISGEIRVDCTRKFETIIFSGNNNINFYDKEGDNYIYTHNFQILSSSIITLGGLRVYDMTEGKGGIFVQGSSKLTINGSLVIEAPELIIGAYGDSAGEVDLNGALITASVNNVQGGEILSLQGIQMQHRFSGAGGGPTTTIISEGATLDTDNQFILGLSETEVHDNASLLLGGNFSTNRNITLYNGAEIWSTDFLGESVTLSGRVRIYQQAGNNHASALVAYISYGGTDLTLTGNLEGGKIVPGSGTLGSVIVNPASGKVNNSAMPNGKTKPEPLIEVLTDSSDAPIAIFDNTIVVVNGKRGQVTIHQGGILKGKGVVHKITVLSGGRVAPGESPGILNAGNTTFEEGSFFEVEIAGNTVGEQYDQLKVAGTVSLGSATLDTKFLNDFKPKAGDTFTIIDNDGDDAVTGTFKDLPEGATFTIDGVVFKISYVGGDGNDVVLSVAEVPNTPSTGFALLSASPLATLLATLGSSAVILAIARKYGNVKN